MNLMESLDDLHDYKRAWLKNYCIAKMDISDINCEISSLGQAPVQDT